MGAASAAATSPLMKMPILTSIPRRLTVSSLARGAVSGPVATRGIVNSLAIVLLLSRVVRGRAGRVAGAGVGPSGRLDPLRGQPGHDVGDLLIAHGPAGHVAAPVRRSKIGPAHDDDRAQALLADEREEGVVRDRAALRS